MYISQSISGWQKFAYFASGPAGALVGLGLQAYNAQNQPARAADFNLSYLAGPGTPKPVGGPGDGKKKVRVGPDADGYLTFFEAKAHYQFGNGKDLFVDASKIDFSKVSLKDFDALGVARVHLAGTEFSSLNDGLVHGTVVLKLKDKNTAIVIGGQDNKGYFGNYDFEMHELPSFSNFTNNPLVSLKLSARESIRNFETFGAKIVNGVSLFSNPVFPFVYLSGKSYKICYKGEIQIKN